MGQVMTVRSTLQQGMEFRAESSSEHTITMDASVSDGGDNAGFRPMELLLVGLAGCTGMDVISILRKKRQEVTAYEVRVRSERAETDPKVFYGYHRGAHHHRSPNQRRGSCPRD